VALHSKFVAIAEIRSEAGTGTAAYYGHVPSPRSLPDVSTSAADRPCAALTTACGVVRKQCSWLPPAGHD